MRMFVAAMVAVAGFVPSVASTTPGAPVITSVGKHLYVNGMATNFVGTPGVFKLSDPGSTVTGYLYAFDDPSPFISVAAGKSGNATLAITPDDLSSLTLSVQAVDGDTVSPVTSFVIEDVAAPGNIATLGWWKLTGHGRAAPDATGYGQTAKLSGDAAFGCGQPAPPDGYRCSMSVTGKGGQAQVSPSLLPIVANSSLFSVSAWVNVAKCAVSCVALSEDATQVFQFALKYQRVCRAGGKKGACWKFSMPHIDQTGIADYNAVSPPGSAKLGTWTQLTGVFDHTEGILRLYVDGVPSGTSPPPPISPWSGSPAGFLRIGNLIPGGTSHDWNGRISDVCLFFGALQPSDVKLGFQGDKAHPHDGCAALFAKYP